MLGKIGLKVTGPHESDPVPEKARAILDTYAGVVDSVPATVVAAKWTDAMLKEEREMCGERWTVAFGVPAPDRAAAIGLRGEFSGPGR